ncbi:MAG: Glycine cleavage system H protein [Verrucomicrobia subdivision 3 bacterium]|nr:Glycine cleavage system H protein [Limisphaerales bacterium]MCS1412535.1 Glycine cleavage system H protein [Limisphaerales bacterium]
MSSNIPEDLRYAKSHEWIRVEDSIGTIGISDHAQGELAELVFVELPEMGRELQKEEACIVVESVKTASDIYSPVSGKVIEVNELVAENSGIINEDPYGAGWLFRIHLATPDELEALLTPTQYREQIGA